MREEGNTGKWENLQNVVGIVMSGDVVKGVWHKVYKIDLSSDKCVIEDVPDHVYRYFMGGSGMIAYWALGKSARRGPDPLIRKTG